MNKQLVWLLIVYVVTRGITSGANIVLKEENDVFADSDKHYTQGMELLFGYMADEGGRKVMRRLGVRNLIYTPSEIDIADPQPDDRPWAGLTAIFCDDWYHKEDYYINVETAIGVVGEWSQSDGIQTWFHRVIGSDKPEGWDNQIPNEPFINVTLSYYRPLASAGKPTEWVADFTGTYGGSLGTAFINAELGCMARAGWNVPIDYRSALIKPTKVEEGHGLSAYLFASSELRLVLHNVTLGGSFFQDGPKQTMEPLVHDMQLGMALGIRKLPGDTDVGLSYAVVQRSEEFREQEKQNRFGAVTLSVVKSF